MSHSLNKVMVIGNVGKDIEVRITPGGQSVGNFSVATTEQWTDKAGDKKEQTEWHRIVLWGKSADGLQPYIIKGKRIYVEGRLQTRQWEKDGQTHHTTEIKADRVILLGQEKSRERETVNAGPSLNEPITDDSIPF